MKRSRQRSGSVAASLLPQAEANLVGKRRWRKRVYDSDTPDHSHGKLWTYFSAGSLETPEFESPHRRYVHRSPSLAIVLALILLAIYFCF